MKIYFDTRTRMIHTNSMSKTDNKAVFQTIDALKNFWVEKGGSLAEIEMALIEMNIRENNTIFMNESDKRFMFSLHIDTAYNKRVV